jgi:hypothetical protein
MISCVPSATHVLRQPSEALAVTLAHDHRAHEDLDGTDIAERDFSLWQCQRWIINGHLLKEISELTLPVVWYKPN